MLIVMGVHSMSAFWVELVGHVAYGLLLGILVRRFDVGPGYVRRLLVHRGPGGIPAQPQQP